MMWYARKLAAKSGLIYDKHLSLSKILEAGHQYANVNGYTETTTTVGKYITSIKHGVFDGLVNLNAFNCQPGLNSQAVLRSLSTKSDIPFAVIDCEGPVLSGNQLKLLDTIAVGAKRAKQRGTEETGRLCR